jgi:hypothetical protein
MGRNAKWAYFDPMSKLYQVKACLTMTANAHQWRIDQLGLKDKHH